MHPLGDPCTWAHSPTSQLSSTLQCCLSGPLQITRYLHPTAAAAALAAFSTFCQSCLHMHQHIAIADMELAVLLDCEFVYYAMTRLKCCNMRLLLRHP